MPQHSTIVTISGSSWQAFAKSCPRKMLLTPGVINRVSVVVFLIAESNEAGLVKAVLEFTRNADRLLPAFLAIPAEDQLL